MTPPAHSRHGLAVAAVVVGAILFAANGTASKLALTNGLDAPHLVQLRTAGAAIVLVAAALVRDPRSMKVGGREFVGLAVYGLVGVAMVQFCYSVAIANLPVGVALLIEYTAPLLVALWLRFVVKKPVRGWIWIALAACLLGLALVAQVRAGTSLSPIGVLAAAGAAASLATFYLVGSRLVVHRDATSTQAWSMIVATVFWAIIAPPWTQPAGVLGSDVPLPGPLAVIDTTPMWFLVILIAVLGTAVPYLLQLLALPDLGPDRAGLLAMLEPVAAAAIAWIVLSESMTALQVVGGLIVIAGAAMAELASRPPTGPPPHATSPSSPRSPASSPSPPSPSPPSPSPPSPSPSSP